MVKKKKKTTCQYRRCHRRRFDPWVGKIPWRRAWQPTPVFLPGELHGQRSLAGYSPWDFPGKNTGVPFHALLQGIFPNQGSNAHLFFPPALAGWFFTTSATWEPQTCSKQTQLMRTPKIICLWILLPFIFTRSVMMMMIALTYRRLTLCHSFVYYFTLRFI